MVARILLIVVLFVCGSEVASVPYDEEMSCAGEQKVASWDRTTCMACDAINGATFDANQEDCVCATANEVVVETDEMGVRFTDGKRCETFPTEPFANEYDLKDAVDACLDYDPTGIACCSVTHDASCYSSNVTDRRCGVAGCHEMPLWNTSSVNGMILCLQTVRSHGAQPCHRHHHQTSPRM